MRLNLALSYLQRRIFARMTALRRRFFKKSFFFHHSFFVSHAGLEPRTSSELRRMLLECISIIKLFAWIWWIVLGRVKPPAGGSEGDGQTGLPSFSLFFSFIFLIILNIIEIYVLVCVCFSLKILILPVESFLTAFCVVFIILFYLYRFVLYIFFISFKLLILLFIILFPN